MTPNMSAMRMQIKSSWPLVSFARGQSQGSDAKAETKPRLDLGAAHYVDVFMEHVGKLEETLRFCASTSRCPADFPSNGSIEQYNKVCTWTWQPLGHLKTWRRLCVPNLAHVLFSYPQVTSSVRRRYSCYPGFCIQRAGSHECSSPHSHTLPRFNSQLYGKSTLLIGKSVNHP